MLMKTFYTLAMLAVALLLVSCKSDQDRFLAEMMGGCKELGTPASDCKCRVRYIHDTYGKTGVTAMSKGLMPADFMATAQKAALSCAGGAEALRAQYGTMADEAIAQHASPVPAATPDVAPSPVVQEEAAPLLEEETAPASAVVAENEQPETGTRDALVFFCRTRSSKTVLVEDLGHSIRYQYRSAAGANELDIFVPREQVTTSQWDGSTRAMTYAVNIPNGNARYSVYWTAQRSPDAGQPVEAGVHAFIDGRQVADVACDPDSVSQRIEGIALTHADR